MRLNWLRRWLKGKKSPQTNVRKDTQARPQVQQLEDRLVPATLIVNTLADTVADDNQLSLREAIDAVNLQSNATLDAGARGQITGVFGTGDTILFDAALAGGILTLDGTELLLQRSMTLDGEGLGLSIDGNQTSRIFNIDNFAPGAGITVSISNLTLFGGNATAGGNGGAIFNVENLNVFQVAFQSNRADSDGGALFTSTAGTTNITASLFVANTAAGIGGGAIYTAAGTLNIRNTTITGNHGSTVGGGIVSDGTTLTILNSTIVDNQVDSATGTGGGITVVSGVTTLLNSIVAGNFDGTATPQDLDSVNGVPLSAASANNLIGDPATANGLAEGVNGNRIGDGANGVLPSSFIVLPLAYNGGATLTHALTAGVNRARDAGNTTLATNAGLASDQRGAPFLRVFGSAVDLGAYEDQNIQLIVDHGGDNDDGNYSAGNLTLREAVHLANANPGADAITFDNVLANSLITVATDLVITDELSINGLGANSLAISGGGTSRIFFIDDGIPGGFNVSISNLTLTNGFSANAGGALLNTENLSLSFVEITNSTATAGGGIINFGGLSITHSTLAGNNATDTDGGAIFNSSELTVRNSTLSGNRAAGYGSAIESTGNVTLVNSSVVNNRARSLDTGNGNGALDNFGFNFLLLNTLVAGNVQGTAAPTPSDACGTLTGQSNLIGDANTSGGLTHDTNGNIVGNAGNGTLDLNLILNTTLAHNGGRTRTHALVPDSLAINAGNTTLATNANLTTDQRGAGFLRVVGAVDIGAFEVQDATPPSVISVTSTTANGTYGIGSVVTIVVNFSENVTVTGTPQLTLETGASDAVVNFVGGNGTSSLTFNYTVGTNQTSSDLDYTSISALALNGGSIVDGAGNGANLTLPAPGANGSLGANRNIVIDGVRPVPLGFDDDDADNIVSVNSTLNYTVTFSPDINPSTVSAADFNNAGNATINIGNVTYLGNGSFSVPVTPITAGSLILRVHANATINDLAGNSLAAFAQDNDTITVTNNQAPNNIVPSNLTVLGNNSTLLSFANGNAVNVDDDSATITVNVRTTVGTFVHGVSYATVSGDASNNITISGSLINVQKTLDTLYFIAPQAPATATVTITSNDGALQAEDTFLINVVASKANAAPTVITNSTNHTLAANSTFAFDQQNSVIHVGDVDSGTSPVVVNLRVNNGTLNLGSVVGMTIAGNGTGNLTLTGIIAHFNYNLPFLTYTPNTGFAGTDTLQVTINDQGHTGTGGARTDSENITLTVTGPADTTPPTVVSFEDNDADNVVSINSTINYTVTFSEAMNGTTITAADFNNAGNATISIGNVTQTGVGVYNVPVTPTSTGTIILRIPAGAVVQDLAGNNLTVPVQDNDTLTVTTNQPPENTVPNNQTVIAGTGTLFSVANNNSLSVTDDSANVSVNLATNNGIFTFAVNYGVGVTGYNSANMTINGTLANVQRTLDTLFYIAPAANGSANVTITSSDGTLQDVDNFTLTIVNPGDKVNAPPTITAPTGNQNVALGVPFAFANGNKIQVGDPDAGFNPVTVNLRVNNGALNLGSTVGLTVQNNGAGNLTLTGRVDHINYNLASLTYTANSTANDTFAITINDLGNTGTGGAKTASQNVSLIGNGTVVVQNQAPVNTVPVNATVLPGTYYLFSRGNQNAIRVADADLGAGNISVNLRTNAGLLMYAIDYGVATTGYGTSNLTITGPLADVNNTLDTMFLLPGDGATTDGQAPVIVVTSNDNGNTGPGGAMTDVDTISLTFEPANVHVNVPPTILAPGGTQVGSTINFTFANNNAIQIGDKDAGIANVQVTLQVPNGTLNVVNAAIPGTTVSGRGTGTLIITGPVNLINYYLQTLVYTMNALPNTDTLTIFVTDLANTGTGGQKTANANVAISRV
jgi:CSLREA domain-containing protein